VPHHALTTGLCPYRIPGTDQNPDHHVIPGCIIGLGLVTDIVLKKTGKPFIFRCQKPGSHNPPGSLSRGIKDQQAPAAIVPADFRAGKVNGTVSLRRFRFVPEKRTCFGAFCKNAPVKKKAYLVRVNGHRRFLARVPVIDKKVIVPEVFFYLVDLAQVAAAFTTLTTFKRQGIDLTVYWILQVYIFISLERDVIGIYSSNPDNPEKGYFFPYFFPAENAFSTCFPMLK
jgi:hypothetical protein